MRLFSRWVWAALAGLSIALVALVQVQVTGPRVAVRWASDVDDATRLVLEQRYSLRRGEQIEGLTWRYELQDRSRQNIGALVRDRAVADTAYIDRQALTAEKSRTSVSLRPLPFPFNTDREFRDRRQLFQPQSLCLLVSGFTLLRVARGGRQPRRRGAAVLVLLLLGLATWVLPLDHALLRMGDSGTYTFDQRSFESYLGVREIRFEAHLSHAIVGRLYDLLGRTPDAPIRAFDLLMRFATAWFVLSALVVGFAEGWSPTVIRYLGLAVLAPSALLYFGFREFGYLSLNVAAFPLLARGFREGTPRLEAGSLLAGLGAAFHGFGLLALAGAALAAAAQGGRAIERIRRCLQVAAWSTAAYLGWVAVYLIVLALPITQGHTDVIPWRPWLVDRMAGTRVNAAILSGTGLRDLLFTAWVVGAPLLGVAASLWRRYRGEVGIAAWYAVPSIVFSILFWPIQGLGVEMDLVVAAFPAFYALAWVCAHDERRSWIAAALLISAHLAFWRIVLDTRFVN